MEEKFPVSLDSFCKGSCGLSLTVSPFYTIEFTRELVKEARAKPGFIGYTAKEGKQVVGFAWAYKIPKQTTILVT